MEARRRAGFGIGKVFAAAAACCMYIGRKLRCPVKTMSTILFRVSRIMNGEI